MQAYRDKTGFDVRATGLYTCDELRYGASPDGVVVDRATGEEGLLEVKCLYRERKRTFVSAAKPPARFLAQVQGQLALSGHAWCDLAIWIPNHLAIFRVPRDAYYWDAVLKPGLVAFSDERGAAPCCFSPSHPANAGSADRTPDRPRPPSPRA